MIEPLGYLFDFHTTQRVLHNNPADRGPLPLGEFQVKPAWAHEALLRVSRNAIQSDLRVVHINLPKENAIFGFLLPNHLRPRLYLECA